jgi:hypothetical protein
MTRKKPVHVIRSCNPAPETASVLPILPDTSRIIEPEPARPQGQCRPRIDGNDLEIDLLPKLQAVVVGPHERVLHAKWHVEVEAVSNVTDAFFKAWRQNA